MSIGKKTAWTMYGLAVLSALLKGIGMALGFFGSPLGDEAFLEPSHFLVLQRHFRCGCRGVSDP